MHTEQRYHIYTSDNLTILRTLADNSVDAIVTDPPAGIGFMGKEWDKDKGGRDKWIEWMSEVAAECLRVIKPGGHALVWALPRTSHWTATAWEDAGWEPRDRICHVFGSGFTKGANISKHIDRMAGAERQVVGKSARHGGGARVFESQGGTGFTTNGKPDITAPATDAAKQWDGWGTTLKPAVEDYWLFRKPMEKGLNIAQNVLKWGTGGLNIDGCRVSMTNTDAAYITKQISGFNKTQSIGGKGKYGGGQVMQRHEAYDSTKGRWPAHLIHDGSEEVEAVFPVTGPSKASKRGSFKIFEQREGQWIGQSTVRGHDDQGGSASRFFYCAKPGKRERDAGLEELEQQSRNVHPTVKALKLMTYLCRLITPPDGLILDPFTGSGSTGCAAMLEGFRFIGIEQSPEYAEIARRRIEYWSTQAPEEAVADERQEKLFATIG